MNVADVTQLRRGTWKIHHLHLQMTEETGTSYVHPPLLKNISTRVYFQVTSSRGEGLKMSRVIKWLCCISCSMTWPLGD